MSDMDIAKARDNLSGIASGIENSAIFEHLTRNRDRVVSKIVPANADVPVEKRIGAAKDDPFLTDDDVFDAIDTEIDGMLGV